MKKLYIILLILLASSGLSAQTSNLVIFAEEGEQFILVLNGVQQNNDPQTNVKVTDLIGNAMKAKIMFSNTAIPSIDKTIYYNIGMETTYSIKQNNKGKYVLRILSEAPIAQEVPPVQNQQVIVYGATPVQTQTTVTQTTVTQPAGAGENVSMGIAINDQMGGANINMSVNAGTTTSTSYSETTTTTTTTSTNEPVYVETQQTHYVMQGYSGEIGCPWPMDQASYSQARASIQSKTFDDSKLIIAKQVLNSNCMLCSQVKELMLLFSFEDTRLEFAMFAYGRTYDIGNFYLLNDAFDFESTIEELNEYINSYRW